MNTLRARRAAATILLAAGTVLLVPAPAHAICMKDEKGNEVCGDSGTGPAPGQPGAYSGVSGINNGTPGAIGPDGQPMTAATPPVWMSPGYVPPAPVSAPPATGVPVQRYETAPPPGGTSAFKPATPATPGYGSDYVPGSEVAPAPDAAPAAPAGGEVLDPSPTATAAAEDAVSGEAAATMTARATRDTAEPAETTSAAEADVRQASATERFNPVPLLAALGGLLIAGAVVFFVPGARAAVTGVFNRGNH